MISIKWDKQAKERLGEVRLNKYGTPMKIIQYTNAGDITIEFQDEHKVRVNTTYSNFQKSVNNPYDIRVCGKGYIGEGKFSYQENLVINKVYDIWKIMLSRCYDELQRGHNMAYEDCEVCEEWHNLQNFGKWYEDNYYNVGDGKRMHIDKDIIIKGNRIYSPETCLLVPQRINMIFMKKNRKVDPDLPQGIRRCVGGFMVSYNTEYLGIFTELNDAIDVYLKAKRLHIKEVVEDYGDSLPEKVQKVLLSW